MKVSVVVRTNNRPEFLKEALASIELQTHTDWEVLIFDDSASDINFSIYKWFKGRNSEKRITYFTTKDSYDLFKNSWLIAPDISNGEIMVRLDDDDILAEDSLEYLNYLYTKNPELEFSYGSCCVFGENGLHQIIQTKTPFEHPKTKSQWTAYTIPNNHPWTHPWSWTNDYFVEPTHYSSIIHAAKANQLSIFHTYVMRTSSVKKVKDKITMTSNFVDDLEFLGSLDYLGLGQTSVKKILTYVRVHKDGRVSDNGKQAMGQSMYQENFRIRDKVDELRTSGFLSKVITPLDAPNNSNNGVDSELILKFTNHHTKIKHIVNGFGQ
jgi:glycosyltransferase involved in cell wall biosynthesis